MNLYSFLTGTTFAAPSSITKGRLECSLSGYHSKVKERFKFSFEKREAHDLFSQRVIFLSLRSGRQKPLRETRRRLSALAWARRRGHQFGFRAAKRRVCLVEDRRATCHTADLSPSPPPFPLFYVRLISYYYTRALAPRSQRDGTARACLEIFHETFSTYVSPTPGVR